MKAMLKALTLAIMLALSTNTVVFAQEQPTPQPQKETTEQQQKKKKGLFVKLFGQGAKDKKSTQQQQPQPARQSAATPSTSSGATRQADSGLKTGASDAPADMQARRQETLSEEEAAVLPYYNNFLTTYRLGPEDVISVEVFNQPRYSKTGIVVPPTGKISYPLIPEGVRVVGKTTEQVQSEITKKLDEYIIDPQVTVSLDKAMSARYSVLGDVGQPGIKIMTRRVSVYEALAEAGGVLSTGDKSKVIILRRQQDGNMRPIPINVKEFERGRAKEIAYLVPGDQVVVPGNSLKKWQMLMGFLPILNFGRVFGLPF